MGNLEKLFSLRFRLKSLSKLFWLKKLINGYFVDRREKSRRMLFRTNFLNCYVRNFPINRKYLQSFRKEFYIRYFQSLPYFMRKKQNICAFFKYAIIFQISLVEIFKKSEKF